MSVKLSYIVPVYKVAPYLRKCVDSLLAQDYEDYEIILVDDGSPDECPQICDEYAAAHDNISIIHQENGGLSAARNTGIAAAKGEYVCFVDSDDYWEKNVLSSLMEQVERDSLDVLRFKYRNVNESYEVFNPNKGDPYRHNDYSDIVTDGVSFLNSRFGTACYAVMFIIRREILDNCVFTEGIYFEDTDWTPRMLSLANHVASTNRIVYNYLVRKGSITKATTEDKRLKILEDRMLLIATLQQQAIDLRKRGRYNKWYEGMIAITVVGIIGQISTDFYSNKDSYIERLRQLNVFPISPISLKARLINLSPTLIIALIHFKNRKNKAKCK